MRLLPRLLLSHSLPILLMGTALGALLVVLLRMTVLLGEVREKELGALTAGERLHRAGWAIEVALRHGLLACDAGEPSPPVSGTLRARAEVLRSLLGTPPPMAPAEIVATARGYLALADSVLAERDTCAGLRSPVNVQRRWTLDEELTDAWVARTSELHGAVAARDEEARRMGAAALSVGVFTAFAALVLGLVVAHRLSHAVTAPLGELVQVAHRVGGGDFSVAVPVQGPQEVERLGRELDRMRVRLAELDALKQGFLASVSHEMRTPLSKLREALGLLSDGVAGPLTDTQARLLKIARTACEREIRTVSTLLDLSRLRAGTAIRFQAGTSMDDALREAVAENEDAAREARVTLDLSLEGEVPRGVLDGAMVERAVSNLVRNAVGVSRAGQTVRIRRALEQPVPGRGGPVAVVSVDDEGPGVPPEIRDSVFNPFVTHAVSNSPKGVGVGLGLALAREVARAHGGELELLEGTEMGARFRLRLPLDGAHVEPRA